nr:Chain B, IQ motif and WD repeat-containing protein 1 [Homo sapiens]
HLLWDVRKRSLGL